MGVVCFGVGSEFDVGLDVVNGMFDVAEALVFFGEIEFYDGLLVPGCLVGLGVRYGLKMGQSPSSCGFERGRNC